MPSWIYLTFQTLKLAEARPHAPQLRFHSIRRINPHLLSAFTCHKCILNAFSCSNSLSPPHFAIFLFLIKGDDLIRVCAESSLMISPSLSKALICGEQLVPIIASGRMGSSHWGRYKRHCCLSWERPRNSYVLACKSRFWWMRKHVIADKTVITE